MPKKIPGIPRTKNVNCHGATVPTIGRDKLLVWLAQVKIAAPSKLAIAAPTLKAAE